MSQTGYHLRVPFGHSKKKNHNDINNNPQSLLKRPLRCNLE